MKQSIENEYNKFIESLQKAANKIEHIDGENNDFIGIQDSFHRKLESFLVECKKNAHDAINATIWDRLVIAFFGETNAGKSTIIETFRILFCEETRANQMNSTKQNVDGLIVGDGQADFTKVYSEYNLSINGHPFTLIDVPGIEGNEDEYKEEISRALNKAHCVFYVQGHNKQPDEKTIEKIRKYLSDWANVYSIYNVRGGSSDYDEIEERGTLLTSKVLQTEELIKNAFNKTLGVLYKGNISIQGLLALCSQAAFAPSREDLQITQAKLIRYFESKDDVFRFSQFYQIEELIEDKSRNYLTEIVEANKQKMVALCKRVYYGINDELATQEKDIVELKELLNNFKRDLSAIIGDAKVSIRKTVQEINNSLFNKLKEDICTVIDNDDLSNDQRQKQIDYLQQKLSIDFSNRLQKAIETHINLMNSKIKQKKKSLDAIKGINLDFKYNSVSGINATNALGELDISFGDVVGFGAATASGALVGFAFTFIAPGVATAVGAIIGGGLHLLRKAIFGDGGKGKAKVEIRKQIEDAKEMSKTNLLNLTNSINSRLDEKKQKVFILVDSEKCNIIELEKLLKHTQSQIKEFSKSIKNKGYGQI